LLSLPLFTSKFYFDPNPNHNLEVIIETSAKFYFPYTKKVNQFLIGINNGSDIQK